VVPFALKAQRIFEEKSAAADVRIAYGGDPFQFGDLRIPSARSTHPLVVNIHGSFWRAA